MNGINQRKEEVEPHSVEAPYCACETRPLLYCIGMSAWCMRCGGLLIANDCMKLTKCNPHGFYYCTICSDEITAVLSSIETISIS